MALFKRMDIWSVYDGLDEIMDYLYNGNEKGSIYWDYYSEQLNELANIAGEMYGELQDIRSRLLYKYDLPCKKLMFCGDDGVSDGHTDISWWNTAACMLSDTDMAELLEREGNYGYSDLEQEKAKRVRALERLTKKQQMALYTEVIGFITRYLELYAAFDTIRAIINELEFHQSAVVKEGKVTFSGEAYV